MIRILLAVLLLGLSLAHARIGEGLERVLAVLEPFALSRLESGEYTDNRGFKLTFEERGGLLYSLSGSGLLDEDGIALASQAIGAATGYLEGIAVPVKQFFETRVGELSGRGPIPFGVEEYTLTLDVSGDAAPFMVTFRLTLPVISEELFPPARHTIGPADATYVVREFSDFQCPACANFYRVSLPLIKEQLLARGDVRFEFHYLPLEGPFINSFPAAEAAECVAYLNGPEGFWSFHSALFTHQRTWANLENPTSYFVDLAADQGLATEGLATCLSERTFYTTVREAQTHAMQVLGLRSTPSVFLGGYRVRNHTNIGDYLRAMALQDALALDE
jgi:protein-disulfide isomerase